MCPKKAWISWGTVYDCVSTVIYEAWYQPKVGISAKIKTQHDTTQTSWEVTTELSKHLVSADGQSWQVKANTHRMRECAKGEGLILVVVPPVFCPLVMFNYHVCGMCPVPVVCSISPSWIPENIPVLKYWPRNIQHIHGSPPRLAQFMLGDITSDVTMSTRS